MTFLFVLQIAICLWFIISTVWIMGKYAYKHGQPIPPTKFPIVRIIWGAFFWVFQIIILSIGGMMNPFCWQLIVMHIMIGIGLLIMIYHLSHPRKDEKYNAPLCVIVAILVVVLRLTGGMFWPLIAWVNLF